MKNFIFIGLTLLITPQVLGQIKTENIKGQIIGSWKFQTVKLKDNIETSNWGLDTVEFRNDKSLTFYSREISNGQIIGYKKLIGTWELKSNLKNLIITIEDETVEMAFKLKGKNELQINHPVKVELDPNLPKDHPNFKTGHMDVKVFYKRIG
jgi:hypothetical protein